MKFESITRLFLGAGNTFRRFPHVILCSAAVSLLLCLNTIPEYSVPLLQKLLMTLSLGVPAYFGLAMFDERYTMKRSTVYLMHGLLAGALALYFFTLPETLPGISAFRYILLMIMVHLGVSFAPFVVNEELNAFWQYNRILLLRFIVALLFSVTLFAGLALATYSVQSLFNVMLDANLIDYILFWCITLNTWLFLNGVPLRVEQLENDTTYPPALKVFAGYVLLPLLMVFFVILYAYAFKNLVQKELLESSITELIFAIATLGLLTYLLLWPKKFSDETNWIKFFKRVFFYLLLPLMLLLTYTTVGMLGSKMIRAELIIQLFICVALCVISVYFIVSKIPSIRMIPLLLFIAFLAAGFGPYNAFERSKKYVMMDLIEVLQRNNRFKNGFFVSAESLVNTADNNSINKSFDYITSIYGFRSFLPYIKPEWKPSFNTNAEEYILRNALLDSLNIRLYEFANDFIEFSSSWRGPIPVSGYDFQTTLMMSVYDDRLSIEPLPENAPFNWKFDMDNQHFQIFTNQDTVTFKVSGLHRAVLQSGVEKGYIADNSKMTFTLQSGNLKVTLLVSQIGFIVKGSIVELQALNATVLVKSNSEK
jgi:hypothetical protein